MFSYGLKLVFHFAVDYMDSQLVAEGQLLELVDDKWREDTLPNDDVTVPVNELPDPEADSVDAHLTLREQDQKWTDIAVGSLHD